MTTTEIPPGTYRIVIAHPDKVGLGGTDEAPEGDIKPRVQYLTNASYVTILPLRGVQPNPDQEWRLVHRGKDYVIERASKEFPTKYITYHGAPAKPTNSAAIELQISGFPGPLSAWHFKPASKAHHTYHIVVAGSEESEKFGIAIAPPLIYPPMLDLTTDSHRHLEWRLEKGPMLDEE